VPDRGGALALLRERVRPGDVVLVKASRSIGLDCLAEALLGDGASCSPRPSRTQEDGVDVGPPGDTGPREGRL
jgi:UDP-N-acetylmuramoyl-tripeptide--D-alanyl-D-alanine ligase